MTLASRSFIQFFLTSCLVLLAGCHSKQSDITLTHPKGYAAPTKIGGASWEDELKQKQLLAEKAEQDAQTVQIPLRPGVSLSSSPLLQWGSPLSTIPMLAKKAANQLKLKFLAQHHSSTARHATMVSRAKHRSPRRHSLLAKD